MSTFGMSESTPLAGGMIAYGDGPAINDPLAPANRSAALRGELASLEQQIRDLQERHAVKSKQLAALETEENT